MNEDTKTAIEALRLPDEVFYSPSDAEFEKLVKSIAVKAQPPQVGGPRSAAAVLPILALGLPRFLADTGIAEPTVPAAVLFRYQGMRQWEVDFNQNLHLVVANLRTGAIKLANPLSTDMLMETPAPSRSGPRPSGIDLQAITRGVKRFNIPPVFGDSWSGPGFAVTAILYDWVSNTEVIERRPAPDLGPIAPRAPSVFLDLLAAPVDAPYTATVSTPTSPQRDGEIRVSGSVTAPRASLTLARSTAGADRWVMVAELLVIGLDAPHPISIPLAVPVTLRGDVVTTAFSFDLAARPETVRLAGEYQVYLVSGRTVCGPSTLTILRR